MTYISDIETLMLRRDTKRQRRRKRPFRRGWWWTQAALMFMRAALVTATVTDWLVKIARWCLDRSEHHRW